MRLQSKPTKDLLNCAHGVSSFPCLGSYFLRRTGSTFLFSRITASRSQITFGIAAARADDPILMTPSPVRRHTPTRNSALGTHNMRDITPAEAAFNSIHPSVIDRLDPTYVKVYNTYIAPFPPPSLHLEQARKEFPSLYRNVKGTATGVGGIGEAWVPGWRKYDGENLVRVYVPTGEEPGMRNVWPVHFNIRGGGQHHPKSQTCATF